MNSSTKKGIILSHPTGNANVRNLAAGLLESQLLTTFYTSLAIFPDTFLGKLIKRSKIQDFQRRQFDSKLEELTHTHPWFELGRIMASKIGLRSLVEHEKGLFSVDNIYLNFDHYVAGEINRLKNKSSTAIYAYEDGAEFSFITAKKHGLYCFYDLPIGYWRTARKLLAKEQERWPAWQNTLTGFRDSLRKLERKDKELQLADHIFVASSFTAATLQDYPGTLPSISVISYGFPPTYPRREYSLVSNRRLKILFVGGLSQRKGIADLLAAVDNIGNDVQLTIVGRKPTEDCEALNSALKKHAWIPSLPHQQILQLMREHDVLVFPSLFEGFGLVITEAMSQGTPVITTNRTAGPDIIKHGKNGWIVEAGSTLALQQAIEYLLENPDDIVKAGNAAIETANARPWTVYGNEIAEAVKRSKNWH